jgi:Flp pilus assembly protein TadG
MRALDRLPVKQRRCSAFQRGATLVEFVVVAPTLLFLLMNLIQYGLLYHAKSQLNYATFEAARAGTVSNANPASIRTAFTRAMTGYYGGGTTTAELATSYAKSLADTTAANVRIEILSPTQESFDDYASPALATRLGTSSRVIPNSNLAFIKCPIDMPGCKNNPKSNASGQTLLDANLLKIRITYGIPERKQIPLAGKFMTWALGFFNGGDTDAFRQSLVAAGRIPVVTATVIRMQSPAYENANASNPGPGNEGAPKDPGPPPAGPGLPKCPVTDPACTPEPTCDPATDPDGCRPPGCNQGDASCDPGCGKNYCCLLNTGQINTDGTPIGSGSATPNQSTAPHVPSILETIK